VSDAKLKEGILTGPQIRELMQDKQFDEDLNETKRNAWSSFKRICQDFLGRQKAANYQDLVQDLLTVQIYGMQYESENPLPGVTWIFSQKIWAKSVTNTVKDFTKTLWLWKSSTRASGPHNMLAEYCCTLKREVPDAKYRTKSYAAYILEESFRLFREHVTYYFAHLNSSVSLKPCLIEKFCIHI